MSQTDDSPVRMHRQSLREFLIECDLVKFGRSELDIEQREVLYVSARAFIDATAVDPSGDDNLSTNSTAPAMG